MVALCTQLYTRMQDQLRNVALTAGNRLQQAEQSSRVAAAMLVELKKVISGYDFEDPDEEIRFFKEIKPRFLRELFFHLKTLDIEANKPMGSDGELKEYYLECLHSLASFFNSNRFFYLYHATGKTHLDGALFTRKPTGMPMFPEYNFDFDEGFANPYSYKLAKLQAYGEVKAYLEGLLAPGNAAALEPPPLTWTASKADLIELVYGLQSMGVFNNGKADVKSVLNCLQSCFGVTVANIYGYFQSMRIRKKNRTPFLDKMKEHVIRRMDESDEYPRYQ